MRIISDWNANDLSIFSINKEDGESINLSDFDSEIVDGVPMPDLSIEHFPQMLMWPMEQLLVRQFSLPLKKSGLIDSDIVAQELVSSLGDAVNDWWFSWDAFESNEGVDGVVFGLSANVKNAMEHSDVWQQCSEIVPDGWVRMSSLRQRTLENEEIAPSHVAFIDADEGGMFIGVYSLHGGWKGIRRINNAGREVSDVVADIVRTFEAMDYDPEKQAAYGNISSLLVDEIVSSLPNWKGSCESNLHSRREKNINAAKDTSEMVSPNFRRGGWSIQNCIREVLLPWKRTAIVMALLFLTLLSQSYYESYLLEDQVLQYKEGITAAFSRGLPREPVMLDAMAQLRAAAGVQGGAGIDDFLHGLQTLGEVRKSTSAWNLEKINFAKNAIEVFGEADDFSRVNEIVSKLIDRGLKAEIVDTEMRKNRVKFRITWK